MKFSLSPCKLLGSLTAVGLSLSTATGLSSGNGALALTSSPRVVPEAAVYQVKESDGFARIQIRRFNPAELSVAFNLSYGTLEADPETLDGFIPAREGIDFLGVAGSAELPAGTAVQEILIPLLDNDVPDGSRRFLVELQNTPSGTAVQVEILDDEGILEVERHSLQEAAIQNVTVMFRRGDGSILCFGSDENGTRGVIQLHPDGTLNPEFAGGAAVVSGDFAWLDAKDRLLVQPVPDEGSDALVRLLPSGELDSSFRFQYPWVPHDLLFQPDEKILLLADTLIRILSDGSIDPSFSVAPIQVHDLVGLFPDGRILVAAEGPGVIGLFALLADGTIDPDFNVIANSELSALDAWGTILSYSHVSGELLRFNSNGSPDETFEMQLDSLSSLAAQPDGTVLARSESLFRIDRFGSVEHLERPPEILRTATRGIRLDDASWAAFGPGLSASQLGVAAVEHGRIVEQLFWNSQGFPRPWLVLDSETILGVADGFLVRVRARDLGASSRPARDRQLTGASQPRVLLWREGDPANSESVQCLLSNRISGTLFTRTATFPPGESKIWLDLPEIALSDSTPFQSFALQVGESAAVVEVVAPSNLRPGSIFSSGFHLQQPGRLTLVNRRDSPELPWLQTSSTLETWNLETNAVIESIDEDLIFWTVPASEEKGFFRTVRLPTR